MKSFFSFVLGALVGATVLGGYAWTNGHRYLTQETASPDGFDTTVAKLSATIEGAGWQIPKVHRLDKSMEKFGHEVNAVAVIELCQPDHAYALLKDEATLGVAPFMPCRIAVWEKDDGSVVVGRMNAGMMSNLFQAPVSEVMNAAATDLEEIIGQFAKAEVPSSTEDAEPGAAPNAAGE